MPVSESTSVAQKATLSADQRKAAAALLRANTSPTVAELGELFTRAGHELALVGGPVRDVFLGGRPKDLDLTTDAVPERVLEITRAWADKTWTVGIEFGTDRPAQARRDLRDHHLPERGVRPRRRASPTVKYGTSLVGGPGAAGLHDQRDGGAAALVRARRPVRRPGRAEGEGDQDAGAAGGLLLRRPAADPAGGAVRRPARLHRGRRGPVGDGRAWRRGCRSCRRSGSPTSCPS